MRTEVNCYQNCYHDPGSPLPIGLAKLPASRTMIRISGIDLPVVGGPPRTGRVAAPPKIPAPADVPEHFCNAYGADDGWSNSWLGDVGDWTCAEGGTLVPTRCGSPGLAPHGTRGWCGRQGLVHEFGIVMIQAFDGFWVLAGSSIGWRSVRICRGSRWCG